MEPGLKNLGEPNLSRNAPEASPEAKPEAKIEKATQDAALAAAEKAFKRIGPLLETPIGVVLAVAGAKLLAKLLTVFPSITNNPSDIITPSFWGVTTVAGITMAAGVVLMGKNALEALKYLKQYLADKYLNK